MGYIYRKDGGRLTGNFETEPSHKREDMPISGQEYKVNDTDILVQKPKSERKKRVKGRFVSKIPIKSGLSSEQQENQVFDSYNKFVYLREINRNQKNSDHKFNLPLTVRLTKADDGSHSILATDLTDGGKNKLYDLKYYFEFKDQLDERSKDIITETIKADLDLAEKYNVRLNIGTNVNFPLDAWCFVKDEQTGNDKVYIMDVGRNIKIGASAEELKRTRELIEDHLRMLRVPRKKF